MNAFKLDIINSGMPNMEGDVDELVDAYNSVLAETLQKHAPIKRRIVTIHPDAKWMNDDIRKVKTQKRKAERTWRKTDLVVHKEIYIEITCITQIAVSDSGGCLNLVDVSKSSLQILQSWKAHEYEAWICAYNYWDPNIIYSGMCTQ